MKIALIQLNIMWEDKPANYRRAETFVRKASQEACDVVVFPEMFNTGFSMDASAVAEPAHGETSEFLSAIAKEYGINVIAGFAERISEEAKARNVATVHNREGILIAKYTKMYPFSLAREDRHYLAGETPVTFTLESMPASLFICYDLRFPEIFRQVAKASHLMFVIANWPTPRIHHWEVLLQARAIENQCFVIGVNRTGSDSNGLEYPGASHLFDPMGNNLSGGDAGREMLIAECDPRKVIDIRAKLPFLQDMRRI